MTFSVYKLGFELFASHSNTKSSNKHFHSFTITLYINKKNDVEIAIGDISKNIDKIFTQFQDKDLSEIDLFSDKDTSIEAIGDRLFHIIKNEISCDNYGVIKLSIYDSNVHTYSVSEAPIDSDVNQISDLFWSRAASSTDATKINELVSEFERRNAEKENAFTGFDSEIVTVNVNDFTDSNPVEKVLSPKRQALLLKNQLFENKMLFIICFILLLVASAFFAYIIMDTGNYPKGSDIYYHLYRSDFLYNQILGGNYYPLYDNAWYNGMQVMRYWQPLPVYFLTFCQFIVGGDMINSYVLCVTLMLSIGTVGWMLIGMKYNRVIVSFVIGICWFFLPENMSVLFSGGNIPRGIISMLTPFLLYAICVFLDDEKWSALFPIIILTACIGLCHLLLAAMLGATIFIYLCIYAITHKCVKKPLILLINMACSFLSIMIIIIPALKGGIMSMGNNEQIMKTFFQDGFLSLNPLTRLQGQDIFYFGLTFFITFILGIFMAGKKSIPGFVTAIFIFLCTTLSLYPIISALPLNELFWMWRFVPIATALALLSFVFWNKIQRGLLVVLCVFMVLDCVPSIIFYINPLAYKGNFNMDSTYIEERTEKFADSTLITLAKENTKQRMTVIDMNAYGSTGAFMTVYGTAKTKATMGWGWQGANTASNIVMLNTAFETQKYDYLFDRCIELGSDTVLIRKSSVSSDKYDNEALILAAEKSNFYPIEESYDSILFRLNDAPDTFGIVSKYDAIAIGRSAQSIALDFPNFKETKKINLNDFTFDGLKEYKFIYLSDFTMSDREVSEKLITDLGNHGVKIFVDVNRVPMNKKTRQNEFLGVYSQTITFEDALPDMFLDEKKYSPRKFDYESDPFITIYLQGIDNSEGMAVINEKPLVFLGSKDDNPNVKFIGLNLLYYSQQSNDDVIYELLETIFENKSGILPNREIIPIEVTYNDNSIVVNSEVDDVNTTLAFHDIFSSEQEIYSDNNLTFVKKGETFIEFNYPFFKIGVIMNLLGIVVIALVLWLSKRVLVKKKGVAQNE